LFLLLGGCGVPGPAGKGDTFGLDFSVPQSAPRPGAIVFVVDGLNARIVEEMLQAGELPALKKYFVDRGLYAPCAVASTPSVTLANLTSVVTGQFPGHHGITGVNWFDRNQLIWRNYQAIAQKNALDGDYTAATIYELLGDELTFSLFFQPHRGATKFFENWTSAGPPFFFGWYEYVDRLTLYRLKTATDLARQCRRFPALTIAYLLAPDFRAYGYGVSSPRYAEALRHTDRQIGRVLGDIERAGLLDKTIIAVVSDHGMGDVHGHFHLQRFLSKQMGLKIGSTHWWESDPFEERLEDHQKVTTIPYGSGDRYWALCMRKPIRKERRVSTAPAELVVGMEPWLDRPAAEDLQAYPARGGLVNIPEVLAKQEAVDAVAYACGPDRVRVRRRSGEVEFRQDGGRGAPITCRLISGADVLGWEGKVSAEALKGRPLTGRQWLEETIDTDYPDLPAQILSYFRAHRAGDIAVFATPGWDFNNVNRAGHGGLRREDMLVPLMLAGPGVPQGRIGVARSVDLMPTLLKLLGRGVPSDLDGAPLVP
jgi:hypothetical protein